VPLEIRILCEPSASASPLEHRAVFADNGVGFGAEDLSKVFSSFRRLREGTPQQTAGARFVMCRSMVEAMHGELTLTSLPGKGDRFLIRLPRTGRIQRMGGDDAAVRNPDLVVPSAPGVETIRLLMVVGSEDQFRPLSDLLREAVHTRFEAEWATGVSAGAQALLRWDYDICLIEHEAPGNDALALLRDPTCMERAVPAIAVRDHEDRDLAFAAIRYGAADVLVRGQFGAMELERALRYAVDRTRMRRELEETRQHAERARELRAIERMGTNTQVPHTARAFDSSTIQEAVAESFEELTETFETLLNAAVEGRVLKVDHDLPDAYDLLARRIGFLGGGPRDTVQVFTEVLKRKAKTANQAKLRLFTEEARLILLEVMGRLVSYYVGRRSEEFVRCAG
jgi:DNA-binding response OmpR family regulator